LAQPARWLWLARRWSSLAGRGLRGLRRDLRQLVWPEADAGGCQRPEERKPPHESWGYRER